MLLELIPYRHSLPLALFIVLTLQANIAKAGSTADFSEAGFATDLDQTVPTDSVTVAQGEETAWAHIYVRMARWQDVGLGDEFWAAIFLSPLEVPYWDNEREGDARFPDPTICVNGNCLPFSCTDDTNCLFTADALGADGIAVPATEPFDIQVDDVDGSGVFQPVGDGTCSLGETCLIGSAVVTVADASEPAPPHPTEWHDCSQIGYNALGARIDPHLRSNLPQTPEERSFLTDHFFSARKPRLGDCYRVLAPAGTSQNCLGNALGIDKAVFFLQQATRKNLVFGYENFDLWLAGIPSFAFGTWTGFSARSPGDDEDLGPLAKNGPVKTRIAVYESLWGAIGHFAVQHHDEHDGLWVSKMGQAELIAHEYARDLDYDAPGNKRKIAMVFECTSKPALKQWLVPRWVLVCEE